MIERLDIENFQSHKETTIEFDPGVNVLIGQSDCGKTAVLRALDWVCNNRPSGDDFRSDWGGDTRVSLSVDGSTIIREKKGKTGNTYQMDDMEFKSFNKGVPREITDRLNLSTVNWQRQHDAPFLLSSTPGEIATLLNQIVNLDRIDVSLSRAIAKTRAVSQEITAQEELLEQAETDLKSFEYLDDLEKRVKSIEDLNQKGNEIEDVVKGLEAAIGRVGTLEDTIASLAPYKGAQGRIDGILVLVEERDVLNSSVESLENALEGVQEAEEVLEGWKDTSNQLDAVTAILDGLEESEEIQSQVYGIERILEQGKRVQDRTLSLAKEITELEQELPDVCPICGGKMQ